MITEPWSPSLDLIPTSIHHLTLDLPFPHGLTQWSGPLGGPDCLCQISPACPGVVSLSYQGLCPALTVCLGDRLLRAAGSFCSPAQQWLCVMQLCTTLFDHCVSYLLLSTLKDKIKTDVLAVQTSWTREKKKKQRRLKVKGKLSWMVHLTSLKKQEDIKVQEKINKYRE